jgi:hypothetical protein
MVRAQKFATKKTDRAAASKIFDRTTNATAGRANWWVFVVVLRYFVIVVVDVVTPSFRGDD